MQGSVSGEALARQFVNQDFGKEGMLNIEGFKAAALMPEFMFRVDEANEVFSLLQRNGQFNYRDYLVSNNQYLRPLLLGSARATSQTTLKSDSAPGNHP